MRTLVPLILAISTLVLPHQRAISADPVITPHARLETHPVPHDNDAADDPAIWIHPTDPARSLILGTDKQGGLFVYDMAGHILQEVSDESHPDNVNVLYNFDLNGKTIDLAIAATRADRHRGVKIWKIDPKRRRLADITHNDVIRVFGGDEPYGSCVYRSPKSGKPYFFVNHKDGRVEQYELRARDSSISARKVRSFSLKSLPEGCVADDDHAAFFIGEEKVGIWKFDAEPDSATEGKLIARVGDHGLTADVEGLTIYRASAGQGYLIASSQGNDTFKVYNRTGDHAFICTIDPKSGDIDDVNDSDGIDVTNVPTSKQFPKGFLIVQDGSNHNARQNFKLYPWEEIAGDRLLIDTATSPRKSPQSAP